MTAEKLANLRTIQSFISVIRMETSEINFLTFVAFVIKSNTESWQRLNELKVPSSIFGTIHLDLA